jgi:hypothetical protein
MMAHTAAALPIGRIPLSPLLYVQENNFNAPPRHRMMHIHLSQLNKRTLLTVAVFATVVAVVDVCIHAGADFLREKTAKEQSAQV